jgi:hypothetical protein
MQHPQHNKAIHISSASKGKNSNQDEATCQKIVLLRYVMKLKELSFKTNADLI